MQKPSPAHRLLTLAALLAALPAAAAPDKITDLGDSSDYATAINENGSIVVGGLGTQAAVWSGTNWAKKTILGTLKTDDELLAGTYLQPSALGVSGDGSVVVGHTIDDKRKIHAIVWYGNNWEKKIDLGTHGIDNSDRSEARAVSRDGKIITGYAAGKNSSDRATVWSGSNWATKTDLGTLATGNSGVSYANAISSNGSVVVGTSTDDSDRYRAVTWSGNGWSTITDLGTLSDGNFGRSFGYGISGDGSVVVGKSVRYGYEERAVAWYGSGWTEKTDLGTLKKDNSGSSSAVAANGDGSVLGGYAFNDDDERRAVVWSGSNWADKTDLGTLTTDNSGDSRVSAISADGNFAVGEAENDNGNTRAVVWNLRSFNIRAADTANTRASLSLLSADTAAMLAQRARAAENLLGGCRTDGGKFCYSAGYRRDIGHGASSRGADFAFGYGISDNFDAAVSLAVPARAEENGSHRLKSGVGIGLSARIHNGAGWYAVPAAAFETDKTRIRRPHLDGTESPENTVRTKGRAYSLTAGRDYGTSGEKTLGWYAALRRTEAERPSYSEDASLSFPFTYGAAKLKETSLAAGIKGHLPLTGKLAWYGNAEVAQRVGGGKARFTASAPFFGAFEEARETTRTRPSVQTGVDYAFSPSAVLSLGGYIGRNAFSGTDKGMFLKLNGKF